MSVLLLKWDWKFVQMVTLHRLYLAKNYLHLFQNQELLKLLVAMTGLEKMLHNICISAWLFHSGERFCIKCQNLFSGKNKKNVSVCHLLKILPSMLSIKSQFYVYSSLRHLLWNGIFFLTCLDTIKANHMTCFPHSCTATQKVLYSAPLCPQILAGALNFH